MSVSKIDAIFTYMGCKSDLLDWIIPHFPPHRVYIELFSGTYSVGLNKPKAKVEIYNDFNGDLSNLFYHVAFHFEELCEVIDRFIFSKQWYSMFKHKIDEETYKNDLERAAMYYFIMCTTFRGKFDGGFSWKTDPTGSQVFERKRENLKRIHNRIKNIIFLNNSCFDILDYKAVKEEEDAVVFARTPLNVMGNGEECLRKLSEVDFMNDEDIIIYADPPYVDTESYYKSKAGEFGINEHMELRDKLAKIKGHFFVSYEDDPLVRDLYSDYKIHTFEVTRGSSGVKKTEVLVTNYDKPMDLFNQF